MTRLAKALAIVAAVLLAMTGAVLATLPSLVGAGKADLALATTAVGRDLAQHNRALEQLRFFLHEEIGGDTPLEHFAVFKDVLNVEGRSKESYKQLYQEAGQGLDEMGILPLGAKDPDGHNTAPNMYVSLVRLSGRLGQTLGLAEQHGPESQRQMAISVWEIISDKYPILRSIQQFNRIPQIVPSWWQINSPLYYVRPRAWPWVEAHGK